MAPELAWLVNLVKVSNIKTTSVSLCVYKIRIRVGWPMPTAALEGHVIVDYGLQLGHARYKIAKDAM